jgi:hypothetical protein
VIEPVDDELIQIGAQQVVFRAFTVGAFLLGLWRTAAAIDANY